jgi:spoIIIJ-associated protein
MKKNRRMIPQSRKIVLDYSEKWGKDVDEAVKLALTDLKLSKEEVNVTVLEEPVKGFLGIGAKLAKVRVEKKDVLAGSEEGPLQETSDEYSNVPDNVVSDVFPGGEKPQKGLIRDLRKSKTGENGYAGTRPAVPGKRTSAGAGPARAEKRERERRNERGKDAARNYRDDKYGRRDKGYVKDGAFTVSFSAAAEKSFSEPEAPDQRADRDSRAVRADSGGEGIDYNAREEKYAVSRPENLKPVNDDNVARVFLCELAEKMGLDVNIQVYDNEECVYIEIDGPDSRTVIGKRGQTLDAIQYLTNLVVNKKQNKYIRVIVDVEGYRSRREKTLEQLAAKLAKKVERTGKNVRLEPMNPYERKVIHSTLQSNLRVTTRSEGEEPYRRVIIERK